MGQVFRPRPPCSVCSTNLIQEYYPLMFNTLRKLSGGAPIMLPSSVEDLQNDELAEISKTVQHSADGRPAAERIKLMQLV